MRAHIQTPWQKEHYNCKSGREQIGLKGRFERGKSWRMANGIGELVPDDGYLIRKGALSVCFCPTHHPDPGKIFFILSWVEIKTLHPPLSETPPTWDEIDGRWFDHVLADDLYVLDCRVDKDICWAAVWLQKLHPVVVSHFLQDNSCKHTKTPRQNH